MTRSLDNPTPAPARRSQAGQVVAMLAIGIAGFIALSAFVVDLGSAYRKHRHTQAAADASALAAAQMLPSSTSQASSAASSVAAQNFSDGTVTVQYSTTYVANDTVTATAAGSAPSFFAKMLGFSVFNTKATATARVESYTGWSDNIAPWTIDKSLKWGQVINFKVDSGDKVTPGNFGGVNLPIKEYNCNLGTGGNDYRDLIGNARHSCLVKLNDTLTAKTGNLTGPTNQGLDQRGVIQNFDPYSILKQQPNGEYVLATYNHPNLVVIPVIDGFSNGKTSFTVVGFAWFIITSYTNNTVKGMFIGSEVPNGAQCSVSGGSQGCPTGAYNELGFKVISLVS